MSVYVRVKLNNQIPRPFWAIKKEMQGEFIKYIRCNKKGEWGLDGKLRVIIVTKADLVWEKPAQMNKKYAQLETD